MKHQMAKLCSLATGWAHTESGGLSEVDEALGD